MGINLEHDEYISRLIKKKARQLTEHHAFTKSDQEDIEQELWLALLQRSGNYDPEKSSFHTFAYKVIQDKISDIIKSNNTLKHLLRLSSSSLDDDVTDFDGDIVARHETIDQNDYMVRTGKLSRSKKELQDLSLDIEQSIAKLPKTIQEFCKNLLFEDVSDISNRTGEPKYKLYRRIGKIRTILEKFDLNEYF